MPNATPQDFEISQRSNRVPQDIFTIPTSFTCQGKLAAQQCPFAGMCLPFCSTGFLAEEIPVAHLGRTPHAKCFMMLFADPKVLPQLIPKHSSV